MYYLLQTENQEAEPEPELPEDMEVKKRKGIEEKKKKLKTDKTRKLTPGGPRRIPPPPVYEIEGEIVANRKRKSVGYERESRPTKKAAPLFIGSGRMRSVSPVAPEKKMKSGERKGQAPKNSSLIKVATAAAEAAVRVNAPAAKKDVAKGKVGTTRKCVVGVICPAGKCPSGYCVPKMQKLKKQRLTDVKSAAEREGELVIELGAPYTRKKNEELEGQKMHLGGGNTIQYLEELHNGQWLPKLAFRRPYTCTKTKMAKSFSFNIPYVFGTQLITGIMRISSEKDGAMQEFLNLDTTKIMLKRIQEGHSWMEAVEGETREADEEEDEEMV